MNYWETKIESLLSPTEEDKLKLINGEGLDGWELAAISRSANGVWAAFYFKRKISEDEMLIRKRELGRA